VRTLIRVLAAVVRRMPVVVLVVTLAATVGLGALATTLEEATGQEGFSPESEEIEASERIRDHFGDAAAQTVMQVVLRSPSGDVLTVDALRTVGEIATAVADSDAAHLVSQDPLDPGIVSFLTPVQQALAHQQVDPSLLDDDAVKSLREQALLEDDEELGITAQLVPEGEDRPDIGLLLVFIDTEGDIDRQIDDESTIASAIRSVDPSGDLEVRPFSFALLFEDDDWFLDELVRLFLTAFAIIVGVLMFVYWLKPIGGRWTRSIRRTVADTSVTMLTIVIVVLWMNGLGALLQRIGVLGPLTEVAQIVPILLIGLGVDYGIHLTSRYRDEVGLGHTVDGAMGRSIGTVGIALVLATVTTAIGFLTNVFNPIPALRDFGILAALGITVAFLLMLTFVPALRVVLDRRAESADRLPVAGMGATRERLLPKFVAKTSVLAEKVPIPTLVLFALLGGLGYLGMTNLSTEFSFTDFLPEDAEIVETIEIIEDGFGGGFGETTQVLIEGDELATPEIFNATASAVEELADTPDVLTVPGPVGEVASAASPLSVIQQLLMPGPDGTPADPSFAQAAVGNGFDPETGRVSDQADVSAIYDAAMASAPDEFGAVVAMEDGRAVASLIDVSTRAGDQRALELRDEMVADLAPVRDAGADVIITSNDIITAGIVDSLSDSQVTSLFITLIAATLVLMFSFWMENRRPLLGVLTMIPVALVVLWTFGLMYVSGIPFGPVTATLTGLAVGIGVPYTIHMARRFDEDRRIHDDLNVAIRETTRNTGGALAGSAFTTAAGFGILVTSTLVPFQQMGQVTAYAIVLALLGAVLVLPSLLVLWERWHRRRSGRPTRTETDEPPIFVVSQPPR
jgi:uncharacterized protein